LRLTIRPWLRDGGDSALLVGLLATVPGRDLDRQLSDHQIDEAPRGQSAPGQPPPWPGCWPRRADDATCDMRRSCLTSLP